MSTGTKIRLIIGIILLALAVFFYYYAGVVLSSFWKGLLTGVGLTLVAGIFWEVKKD